MAVYLKKFENHTQYDTYINGSGAILPNVSICTTEGDVHYNPYVEPIETRVVAKYNVTDTSSPTPIGYNKYTSGFSEIEIDGVVQPSVVSAYTFDTVGEHTVKYTLTDPTSIGNMSFFNCTRITNIVMPDSITSIGSNAFFQTSITSIDIPSGVTNFSSNAFQYCTGLTSINIPSGITSLNSQTFSGCYALTSVTIPNTVTTIANGVFSNCTSLSSISIPNGITSIENGTFSGCYALTSIDIPSGVTSIGDSAFGYCSGLTSLDLPTSLVRIGENAFYGCSGFTSIVIPSGVALINSGAFQNCTSLETIICNAITAPTIKSATFMNIKTNGTLYVPQGSTGYDTWMRNSNFYLGLYNWTKVEQ